MRAKENPMRHPEYNEARFAKVLQYLHRHYPHEIDLARLADIACLSPCHWHRIYRAVMGETIAETLKRIRLHHAAHLLLSGDKPLAEVARACGYGGNAQSFIRIFREAYGQHPQDYRARGGAPCPAPAPVETSAYPLEIRDIAPLPVAILPHHGDYMNIGATLSHAESLLTLRGQLPAAQARYFGIYYDDPDACPASALRAEVAIYTGEAPVAAPFEQRLLPGGRYAVLHHRGTYAGLHRAYDWLCRDWLLQSPYRLAETPCIEEYRNDCKTTPPQELLTDIWLPLASDNT